MPQYTQDGSRIKRLTDEFAHLSKPRPAAGAVPPVQGVWTLGAIAEKFTGVRALDFGMEM
jgi:hypothetical protein